MKTWHLLAGGILAGTCAAVLFTQQMSSRDELDRLSSEVERLSTADQESRVKKERTPPTLVREVRVEVPAPSTAPSEPASQPTAPPPATVPSRISEEQVSQRIQDLFGNEPPDSGWARTAEHVAEDGVRAALPERSLLRSVECRASMCRIETEHGDSESSYSFVRTAFMTPEHQVWNGAFLSMRGEGSTDGKVVTVTYLAREGTELPMKELLASGIP